MPCVAPSRVAFEAALAQITPGDIERYVAERLAQERRLATYNPAPAFLKKVSNVAIDDGLCVVNPVRKVKLLQENNERVRRAFYAASVAHLSRCLAIERRYYSHFGFGCQV